MNEDRNVGTVQDGLFDEDDEDTQKDRFLTFHLNGEDYGLEISYVIEIVGIQKITEVPDMPDFVKGVINLRGRVIPVVDVRTRFRMPNRDYDERTCVIVVDMNGTSVGLVVDTVREVREIPEASISPPPQVAADSSSRYILGLGRVGDEVKILLDCQKLLLATELVSLRT